MVSLKKIADCAFSYRNRLLLPIALMLLSAGYLHMVWFPGVYSEVLENSQRAEADYLQILGQRVQGVLEQEDAAAASHLLQQALEQHPAWMSIELDGSLENSIHVQQEHIPASTTQTYISLPLGLRDDLPLTLSAGIDFSSHHFGGLMQLRIFELLLVTSIVLAALGGYYLHENSVRKPLLALSRTAERLMHSVSHTTQPMRMINELGKLTQVLTFLHSELIRCQIEIEQRHRVLEIIRKSQLNFIRDIEPGDIFFNIIGDLLDLTDSEFGYLGEILYHPDGSRYLRVIALKNNGLYDAAFDELQGSAMSIRQDTLTGRVINQAGIVTLDSAAVIQDVAGLDNYLPLPNTYIGIPFMRGAKVIGMLCLANRKQGYDAELIDSLQPIASTCTSLVEATKNERERARVAAELEDKVEHIKAIVDTVVDGIITINEKGIIESFNPAAEMIFGYRSEEVAGKNVSLLMPESYRHAHNGYLENYCLTGERKVIGIGREVEGLRRDGSVFPMDLAVSEMYAGGARMFTGVVRDITERKAADRIKNEFISVVSHELRTPLTSIHGSLRLIEGGMAGKISRNCTELVRLANKNVERLIRLINDLLDIEKMEAGKYSYQLEPMGIRDVLEYAIRESSGYAQEHDVTLACAAIPDDIEANIDRDRIIQVMVNLLSNAVKFSPENSVVEITAGLNGNQLRVSVTDHGTGIPSEFQDSVFKKFCQSDSSDSRKLGGTGLGLSICKSIIEGHGGKIGFDTMPGQGTTFYFELPATTPATAVALPGRLRILLCNADDAVAEHCDFLLRNAGFDIDKSSDTAAAVRLLDEQHYDAMILDLPARDAMAFASTPSVQDVGIPVIMLCDAADDNAVQTVTTDTIRQLYRPIDGEVLVDAVLQCVQHGCQVRRILHIEDDPDMLALVQAILADTWQIIPARSLAEARKLLIEHDYDLVMLDIGLPDGSGLDLLPDIRQREYPVMLFSEEDSIESAMFSFDAKLVKSYTSSATLLKTVLDLTEAA
ncbi:MAG: PAS domain S-box protein [Pseudomonadota bacterium]